MKPERPDTTIVLIDMQYYASMNKFEETYGDNVTYQELEQRSYIEFKELMFLKINENIKFRKYGRIGNTLTLKVDMLQQEIEKFKRMLEKSQIDLVYEWIVTNVTILKDADIAKKMLSKDYNEDDDDENNDNKNEGFEEFDNI